MANRNNYTQHSHKGFAVFCVAIALMVAAVCTLGGLQLWGKDKTKPSNWFKDDTVTVVEDNVKYETTLPANGGMTLPDEVGDGEEDKGEVKSNGIALMSAMIPVAQYAEYGISPAAENARTVTATVSPDNEASNTKIRWELSWKDAASLWARGKNIADYVTLSTDANDLMKSKTCTISCSQAFGEQIQLKAVCVEDTSKFAVCPVDYVQQLKSASASIGNVPVNLGGNTDVTIAIRREWDGKGGTVTVTPNYSDVYTVKSTFTGAVTITTQGQDSIHDYNDANRKYVYIQYGSQAVLQITAEKKDYTGEAIYFDTRLFKTFNFSQFGIDKNGNRDTSTSTFIQWADFTGNEIKNCYTNLNCQGKVLFTMKVTLASGSYEYSYESDIVWAAIDETVPLANVHINGNQDIVFP